MAELIYKELSFQIVGALYEVYNQLRYGHPEKIYQRAFANELSKRKIPFQKELYYPIIFKGNRIGNYYLDFLVENKVVVELKIANDFYQKDINQMLGYIKAKKYRLGILALFTKKELNIVES